MSSGANNQFFLALPTHAYTHTGTLCFQASSPPSELPPLRTKSRQHFVSDAQWGGTCLCPPHTVCLCVCVCVCVSLCLRIHLCLCVMVIGRMLIKLCGWSFLMTGVMSRQHRESFELVDYTATNKHTHTRRHTHTDTHMQHSTRCGFATVQDLLWGLPDWRSRFSTGPFGWVPINMTRWEKNPLTE